MDRARWQRMQDLFHGAVALSQPEARGFLQTQCGDDQELMQQVLAMLRQDAHPTRCSTNRLMKSLFAPSPLPCPCRLWSSVLTGCSRVIGEGGMGVVYRAERTDLGNSNT